MLVGVTLPGSDDETTEASLDELALLVDTAGADEVGRIVQRRDHPDHTWFIGKGKAEELHELCLAVDADTVVFDNELSPAQQFNLEKLLGRTAIDRTAVILDIFAQNAHTLEGKAQVELALLRYRLPRLRRGANANLSQQRGGVGTRFGGGETKLEVDRRRIMRRITGSSPSSTSWPRPATCSARAATAAASPRSRSSATPTPASRRCSTAHPRRRAGRGPPVRHARPDHPPPAAARRRAGAAHRHRRLRAPPAARAGRGVQEHARGRQPAPTSSSTSSTPAPPIPRARSPPCATVLAEIDAAARARAAGVQQGRPGAATRPSGSSPTTRARWPSARSPARASTIFLRTLGDRLRALSDGRRAARPVRPRRRAGVGPPRGRGRVDDRRGRRRARAGPAVGRLGRPAGRVRRRPGRDRDGVDRRVDDRLRPSAVSVRPPRPAHAARRGVRRAASSTCRSARRATRRRRPSSRRCRRRTPSAATRRASAPPALRDAVAALDRPPLRRRRRRSAQIAACVGTKEFVGTLPQWLHLRTPDRDTVLYPAASYPTYEMGAILAGAGRSPCR